MAVILVVVIVLSGCSTIQTHQSPSAEIVGEWENEDYIFDACAGEIDGKPYLFLLTQPDPMAALSDTTLRVLDVDDPVNPLEVASLDAPISVLSPLGGLALSGTDLCVTLTGSGETALWVVDVSDPESPREIVSHGEEFAMWWPCISEDYLAVATALARHFAFFDISRPAEPTLLGELALNSFSGTDATWQADCSDSMFYVVGKGGLAIVDVSSPSLPQEVGFYTNPDWEPEESGGVEGAGTTVIYSIADFDSLEEFFEYMYNSGSFVDVAASEGYAYIAASDSGLVVLDVSDPESVEEVARLALPGKAIRVLVAGDFAYIKGASLSGDSSATSFLRYSVHIVDISNPLAPELADSIDVVDTFPPWQTVIALGDYVYFIDYQMVYVIDIFGGHR